MAEIKNSNVIESLTAFEMSMAEKKAGLSIATLEDPNYPKVDLLGALGWVHAKREEPTLKFEDYMKTRTLEQITDELGITDEDDDSSGE